MGCPKKKKIFSGQSAAELAIFGSIVIFVIGLILKTALSSSQHANMELRSFRMALRESYRTALGQYTGGSFSSGRNNSYAIVVEDRLSVDPSKKQGTRDRAPYMAQGSGTMTINLFMPVNEENQDDLPVYDMFINGQRFPLSISRVVTVIPQNLNLPDCTPNDYGDDRGKDTGACRRTDLGVNDDEFYFFRREYNPNNSTAASFSSSNEGYCFSGGCGGWSADSRFDLDFDGTTDIAATDRFLEDPANQPLRYRFSWQWVRVTEDELEPGLDVDIDGDLKEEKILECQGQGTGGSETALSCKVLDYQEGDFDLTIDEGVKARFEKWRQEQINNGAVKPPEFQEPGLTQHVRAYTFTKDGTMLRNEEGKLYQVTAAGDARFVRNETAQDNLDIIERVLNLSNNTGRFCNDEGTQPRVWEGEWAKRRGLYNMVNPVEACGNCFDTSGQGIDAVDRRQLTCMDTVGPTIFVRSRIRDRRRHRWVTMTQDAE